MLNKHVYDATALMQQIERTTNAFNNTTKKHYRVKELLSPSACINLIGDLFYHFSSECITWVGTQLPSTDYIYRKYVDWYAYNELVSDIAAIAMEYDTDVVKRVLFSLTPSVDFEPSRVMNRINRLTNKRNLDEESLTHQILLINEAHNESDNLYVRVFDELELTIKAVLEEWFDEPEYCYINVSIISSNLICIERSY